MESIPVWGVAIKKAIVDPFEAPSLYIAMAVGITPQEHNGSGIPNKVAYRTDVQ